MQSASSEGNRLLELSDGLANIVERVGQSVVAIHGRRRIPSSGVIWRQGVVVTAAHTLRRDDGIEVTLADGRKVGAVLAGRDAGTDVAVLKLDGVELAPPESGDARGLRPGHLVLAVARGDGASTHADFGVIGSVGGPWRTWRGGQLDAFVQLDGGLHPGFSGAALADMRGQVVGICTSAFARGVGMLIPHATVERVADELLAKGRVSRGYLGVGTQQVSLPDAWIEKMKLSSRGGLLVNSIAPDGPAEAAGVLIGDVLVDIDGKACGDMSELHAAIGAVSIGKPLKIGLIRGGERVECAVMVGERPQRNACR
ncbi:2-alkenal reductase [Caballeronia choica]|uniref:2-alkenal reductase n=1 Tax=Caballeronia choica TaxID=326476 RepID=A0A158L2D3_9BURK|nr:trypsin-like peptidase domain-containing protein [Caballeronia choica]SAL86801.1 2-alkenal reductase [Caballeronia choica]